MKKDEKKTRMTRREFIGKTSAVLASGAALASGIGVGPLIRVSQASQNKHKMVIAFTSPAHPTLKEIGIFKFKEIAEKEGNGNLEVELHCCMELGTELKVSQKTQMGSIQANDTSTQNFCKYVDQFNVLDFPYIFKSMDIFRKTISHPDYLKAIDSICAEKNFKVLIYAPLGFRGLGQATSVKKGVRVPDDIKNLKVRVTGSKIEQQSFAMAGANPSPVAWAECYTALQTGAVDALNVGIAPLYITNMYETFKYWTPINFMTNTNIIVCNLKWYNSLPDSIQDVIQKASSEAMKFQEEKQEANNALCAVKYLERGIQWIQPSKNDMKQWYDKIGHQRAEWDDWKKRVGSDLYETVAGIAGA